MTSCVSKHMSHRTNLFGLRSLSRNQESVRFASFCPVACSSEKFEKSKLRDFLPRAQRISHLLNWTWITGFLKVNALPIAQASPGSEPYLYGVSRIKARAQFLKSGLPNRVKWTKFSRGRIPCGVSIVISANKSGVKCVRFAYHPDIGHFPLT